jgi:hypothetical protein
VSNRCPLSLSSTCQRFWLWLENGKGIGLLPDVAFPTGVTRRSSEGRGCRFCRRLQRARARVPAFGPRPLVGRSAALTRLRHGRLLPQSAIVFPGVRARSHIDASKGGYAGRIGGRAELRYGIEWVSESEQIASLSRTVAPPLAEMTRDKMRLSSVRQASVMRRPSEQRRWVRWTTAGLTRTDSVDEAILKALTDNPFSSVPELSRLICLSRSTVHRRLTELPGFALRRLHWIPHRLSCDQTTIRVNGSRELLQRQ